MPSQLAGTALPFTYNQIDSLAEIVRQQGSRLAAVVMEPTRHSDPAPGFLEGVRELCDRAGAVLVFDEISIGWRLDLGGATCASASSPIWPCSPRRWATVIQWPPSSAAAR